MMLTSFVKHWKTLLKGSGAVVVTVGMHGSSSKMINIISVLLSSHGIILIPKIEHYYLFFNLTPLQVFFFFLSEFLILESGFSLWTTFQREMSFIYALEEMMNSLFTLGYSISYKALPNSG